MITAMERRLNLLRKGLARIAEGRERPLAETVRRRPVFWSRTGGRAWRETFNVERLALNVPGETGREKRLMFDV